MTDIDELNELIWQRTGWQVIEHTIGTELGIQSMWYALSPDKKSSNMAFHERQTCINKAMPDFANDVNAALKLLPTGEWRCDLIRYGSAKNWKCQIRMPNSRTFAQYHPNLATAICHAWLVMDDYLKGLNNYAPPDPDRAADSSL